MTKHGIVYRHIIAFLVYETDTIHLMTRHHNSIPSKGYLHPVTRSSWLMFFSLIMSVLTLMHFGNKFIKGKTDLSNIFPLLFMFHYEESSYIMKHIRTGRTLIMLCVLIHFSFVNVYNQNIRSSTIEPFFEKLPDHLRGVNHHSSFVLNFGALPPSIGFRETNH